MAQSFAAGLRCASVFNAALARQPPERVSHFVARLADQSGAKALADTCCRAVIDELLAVRGFEYPPERAVFVSDLSVVLMDTTSLSFTGTGAATLRERGYSKDHCPDLMQMIAAVVIDAASSTCKPSRPGWRRSFSCLASGTHFHCGQVGGGTEVAGRLCANNLL